jgi:hypothetical protein
MPKLLYSPAGCGFARCSSGRYRLYCIVVHPSAQMAAVPTLAGLGTVSGDLSHGSLPIYAVLKSWIGLEEKQVANCESVLCFAWRFARSENLTRVNHTTYAIQVQSHGSVHASHYFPISKCCSRCLSRNLTMKDVQIQNRDLKALNKPN